MIYTSSRDSTVRFQLKCFLLNIPSEKLPLDIGGQNYDKSNEEKTYGVRFVLSSIIKLCCRIL